MEIDPERAIERATHLNRETRRKVVLQMHHPIADHRDPATRARLELLPDRADLVTARIEHRGANAAADLPDSPTNQRTPKELAIASNQVADHPL